MKKQVGFTLIELLIVIVVLGILAAYAVPKYMAIDKQARTSVVKSLKGSLETSAEMVHALAIAQGVVANAGSVNAGTFTVNTLAGGYPDATADGIGKVISDMTDITVTPGTAVAGQASTFALKAAPDVTKCLATYTSPANATSVPTYSIDADGC